MIRLTRGKAQVGQLSIMGGTVTGSAGAATLHKSAGVITTESLSTAAGATFTETLTNSQIAAGDVVLVSVTTTGTGEPVVTKVTPAAGSLVIVIRNNHAATAFNAVLKIAFAVIKL
jgi:hypothetical protein